MPAYDATLFAPPAPLAHVTLRHPATGNTLRNVPMLLDSGADITLIPRASMDLELTLTSRPNTNWSALTETKRLALVQLDLLFLRRAFQGRFLLTDQSCGVLGRDILNHLAIVLDGPQLTWDESGKPGKT